MTDTKYALPRPNGSVASFAVGHAPVSLRVFSTPVDRRGGLGPPQRYKFLQEFSVRAWCLTHPLQRLLPGRQRETNYHSEPAIITIREATALPSFPISSETERESGSFVSEMFIYTTRSPKDMEKPLLQVMTVEPQHIIQLSQRSAIFYVPLTLSGIQELFNFFFGVSGSIGFTLGSNSRTGIKAGVKRPAQYNLRLGRYGYSVCASLFLTLSQYCAAFFFHPLREKDEATVIKEDNNPCQPLGLFWYLL